MRLVAALTLMASMFAQRARAQSETQPTCNDSELSALADERILDHSLSANELLARARARGAAHPSLHLVELAPADDRSLTIWLSDLERRGLGPLRCGHSDDGSRRVAVAVPAQAEIDVAFDRVRVRLAPGFSRPFLFVRSGNDEPVAFPVVGDTVPLDVSGLRRPVVLQVVANGPVGPRPVAEMEIGVTRRIPTSSEPPDASVLDVLRQRRGAGPLRPNALLQGLAREHAAAVCRTGHLAHGDVVADPVARMRSVGLVARHVGEAIAAASDLPAAWQALLASPSHRAALGDRRFTDLGIGVDDSGPRTCLVVLLAAWPRRVASSTPWTAR